jgi:hypothetical protein
LLNYKLSLEEGACGACEEVLSLVGPATMAEYQWFFGVGRQDWEGAVGGIELIPRIWQRSTGFRRRLRSFRKFKMARTPQYSLVSSLDSITFPFAAGSSSHRSWIAGIG